MSQDRQLLARRKMRDDEDNRAPYDASAALSRAREARAAAKPRAWAAQFYREVEHTGVPLAKLNDIVAECETQVAAMAKVTEAMANGHGLAAARPVARADVAERIAASHAKVHQPRRSLTRH